MREPRVDPGGAGHVFGSPTGEYMGLTCFSNGSLARERVRDRYGLTWDGFSQALDRTPAGNGGGLMLPWFDPEITPPVGRPGVHRDGVDAADAAANVRAVVEGQQMAMALHARWMTVAVDTILATGGAAANSRILQVMADVFDTTVHRFEVGNSAALGAALRALHADREAEGRPLSWEGVIAGLAGPAAGSRVDPEPRHAAVYRQLLPRYAAFEAAVLARPA
jgi:xylulokinase